MAAAADDAALHLEYDNLRLLRSQTRSDDAGASARHVHRNRAVAVLCGVAVLCLLWLVATQHSAAPVSATCLGDWPSFRTRAELEAHTAWSRYIHGVYGALPPHEAFPMCVGELWQLYTVGLEATGAIPPAPLSDCPPDGGTVDGARYERHSRLSPPNLTWSWHAAPDGFAALPSDTWVEVLHKGGIADEHVGAWFLTARGSGIWLHTGRTLAFDDHDDAYLHFGVARLFGTGRAAKFARNEALVANASAAGYDSIQFIKHTCEMMYGDCLNTSRRMLTFFNRELVSTRLVGIHACASANGTSPLLATGWPHAGRARPCTCDNAASEHLHCLEVPYSLPQPGGEARTHQTQRGGAGGVPPLAHGRRRL